LHDRHYLDSEDNDGNLQEQCRRSLAFIKRNLHHVQRQQGFDTLVQPKLPEEVFEDTRCIFCPAAAWALAFRARSMAGR
jgi:predicted HTH transcriptional regulator